LSQNIELHLILANAPPTSKLQRQASFGK
jgi:hypothetical protein